MNAERESLFAARDPFDDSALRRLVASNQDYQRSHGHYIVPLAQRLLDTRAALADMYAIVDDYAEGRTDSLVALGKIGHRLLRLRADGGAG